MITFKQYLIEASLNDDDFYLVNTNTKKIVRHLGGPNWYGKYAPNEVKKGADEEVLTGLQTKTRGFTELKEEAVNEKPTYVLHRAEEAIDLLNKYAKDALWMLATNKPIYRGDYNFNWISPKRPFAVVDATATERRSQNTSNYYTILFDNHPGRKQFPKRSRSMICTTDRAAADDYANDAGGNIVIPFDGVPIGAVNLKDMWLTQIQPFGKKPKVDIDDLNSNFSFLGIDEDIGSFEEFGETLKDPNSDQSLKFIEEYGEQTYQRVHMDFMGWIHKMYSAKNTGHTAHTTKNLNGVNGEVWVGGKLMLIQPDTWKQMLEAYKR